MFFDQFFCGLNVMIILLSRGCQSQKPPVCGRAVSNTRIVGGQNASPGSWPWQVSLNSDRSSFCAGSLIHNQWVLTAAHCLTADDTKTTKVFLGRHSQSGPNLNEVSRGLDMVTCHPSFNFLTNENDICLLKLSAPVNFTNYIQPVCLASAKSTFHTGVRSWVTGFGATESGLSSDANILQEVDVPIVGNNECRCTHRHLTENMICAGHRAGGKDACQGDSGAPLVTKQDSVWIQSGIVSFGDGCGKPLSPGVYTRVSQYQEWITSVTGSNEPGFVTYTSSGVDSDLNFNCSQRHITTSTTTTSTTTTITTTTSTSTTITPTNPTNTTITPTTSTNTTITPTTSTSTTITPTTSTNTTITTTNPTNTTITPTTSTSTTITPTTSTNTTITPTTSTNTTITPTTSTNTTITPTISTSTTITTTTSTSTTITTTTSTSTTITPTTSTNTTITTKSIPSPAITVKINCKNKDGDSVFDSGENTIHFSHFISLCLVVISLYVLVGDA